MTRFAVRCGWVLPTVGARAAEIELAFKSDLPPPPCLLHHDFKRKQPGSGGGRGDRHRERIERQPDKMICRLA